MQALAVQVLHPYEPRSSDELNLVKGEVLVVLSQCDDGWWVGETTDGRRGVFPSNFVQLIPSSFPSVSPSPSPTAPSPIAQSSDPMDCASPSSPSSPIPLSEAWPSPLALPPASPILSHSSSNSPRSSPRMASSGILGTSPSSFFNFKGLQSSSDLEIELACKGEKMLKSGWLMKKGHNRRNWTLRWFALYPRLLVYYTNPADAKPKGSVPLYTSSLVHIASTPKRTNCFVVSSGEDKKLNYSCAAQNPEEMVEWIQAIKQAVNSAL